MPKRKIKIVDLIDENNKQTNQNSSLNSLKPINEPIKVAKAINRDKEHMARIGSKGGKKTSENGDHMMAIGRKGGIKTSLNRDHMAEIGQMGGETTQEIREQQQLEKKTKNDSKKIN